MLRLILTCLGTIAAGIALRFFHPSANLAIAIYGVWFYTTMDFICTQLYNKPLLKCLFTDE